MEQLARFQLRGMLGNGGCYWEGEVEGHGDDGDGLRSVLGLGVRAIRLLAVARVTTLQAELRAL